MCILKMDPRNDLKLELVNQYLHLCCFMVKFQVQPQQLYKPFHPIYLYNAKSLKSKTLGTSAHSW